MVREALDEIREMINSDDDGSVPSPCDDRHKHPEKVQMKKQLGLLEGVAIILGIIFGSGTSFVNRETLIL